MVRHGGAWWHIQSKPWAWTTLRPHGLARTPGACQIEAASPQRRPSCAGGGALYGLCSRGGVISAMPDGRLAKWVLR